jgi:hypothetical protein
MTIRDYLRRQKRRSYAVLHLGILIFIGGAIAGASVPQVVRLELGRADVTAVCFAESPDVLAEERSGSHRFFRSSASGFTTSIGLPAAHASSRSTPPA